MKKKLQWTLVGIVVIEFIVIVLLAGALARSGVLARSGQGHAHEPSRGEDLTRIRALSAELEASNERISELSSQLSAVPGARLGATVDSVREGSVVSFSYGTPQQAGRFVGGTIRKLFEIGEKVERGELQSIDGDDSDLELSVMSLGPFIEEAEAFEADPVVFARFQSALLGDLFTLGAARQEALERTLVDLKARAAQFPLGSPEWHSVNEQGTQALVSLLTPSEQSAVQKRIDFISKSGILIAPTYSLLSGIN